MMMSVCVFMQEKPVPMSSSAFHYRYLVPLNKKAKIEYINKIKDMAIAQGWSDDFGK